MKYTVIIVLWGLNQCNGGWQHSDFYINVETQEECLAIADDYIQLPFVVKAECQIQHIKER